jgi:hypothetical protein
MDEFASLIAATTGARRTTSRVATFRPGTHTLVYPTAGLLVFFDVLRQRQTRYLYVRRNRRIVSLCFSACGE